MYRILELSTYIGLIIFICYYLADKNELLLSFIFSMVFLITVFLSSKYGKEIGKTDERKEIAEELISLQKANPKELSPDILNIILERLVFKDKTVAEILEITKKLYKARESQKNE